MTRRYKRHSGGGRFKRQDQGDFGLRAYRDQQKTIIDALDRSRRQAYDVGKENLADLKGVAATEQQNAEYLNKLENQIYTAKKDATRIRGQNEVENLKSQAKEAERNAAFWQTWTQTGAAQIGSAAAGLNAAADRIVGQWQWEDLVESGRLDQDAILSKNMFDIVDQDIQKERSSLISRFFRGDREALDLANGLGKTRTSSNHWLSRRAAKYIKDNKEQFFKDVVDDAKKLIKENQETTEWDTDQPVDAPGTKGLGLESIAQDIHDQYAKRILQELGVKPNTEGGKEILDMFKVQGKLVHNKLYSQRKYTETQSAYNDDRKQWVGNINDSNAFAAAVQSHAGAWVTDGKGNFSPPTGNIADSIVAVLTEQAEKTTDKKDLIDLLNLYVPLSPGDDADKRQTVGERLKNRNILDTLNEAWLKGAKSREDHHRYESKTEQDKKLSTLEDKLKSGEWNTDTEENRAKLDAELRWSKAQGTRMERYTNRLAAILNVDPTMQAQPEIQRQLKSALATKDYRAVNDIWMHLSSDDQAKVRNSGNFKSLAFLQSNNVTKSDITSRLTEQLKGNAKDRNLRLSASAENAIPYMVHDVFNNIHTLVNDEKYTNYSAEQIKQEAVTMTMEDVIAGKGLWKQVPQDSPGAVFGQQEFIHFMYDYKGTHLNNTFAGEPELTTALNGSGNYDIFKAKHMGKNTTDARVLDRDTIKAAAIDVQNGGFFRYPDHVNEIAKKYNVDRYKVMNDIFESEDFKQRLGPDLKTTLKKGVKVSNVEKYSDSDLSKIGLYCEATNDYGPPVDKEYGIVREYNNNLAEVVTALGIPPNSREFIKFYRRHEA